MDHKLESPYIAYHSVNYNQVRFVTNVYDTIRREYFRSYGGVDLRCRGRTHCGREPSRDFVGSLSTCEPHLQ
jgi:hypothetical protein